MNAPIKLNKNVQVPIVGMATNMFVFIIAKVIPIARASTLVAIAQTSIFENDKSFLCSSSSFEKASFIMFAPISERRINAIQWSKDSI